MLSMEVSSRLQEELSGIVDTFQVHSADSFSMLGRRHEAPAGVQVLEGSALSPAACTELAEVLYNALHCREPADLPGTAVDWASSREFVERLSAANMGRQTWQPNWIVRQVEPDGRIVAERHGVCFWIEPEDLRPPGPHHSGDRCRVRVPPECRWLLPGFYLALGDAEEPEEEDKGIRLYWHLWSGGAERFLAAVTRRLNRARVPFSVKLLSNPATYTRADAAVIYLDARVYGQALPHLRAIHRETRSWLGSALSGLVKPVAAGVGLAEGPGDGSSFGRDRCRLLASHLSAVDVLAAGSGADRCRALWSELRARGWDPDRMYLDPGSEDRYPAF
jgi:hypothetical protein